MSSQNPTILAIDASTEACSVALLRNGQIVEDYRDLPRLHTRFILPMIDGLLGAERCKLANIDAISFGAGPGSFTGLRVCVATVQGLAFAAELPVIPVSTLHAMAQAYMDARNGWANEGQLVFATLDARMDEVYSGEFEICGGVLRPSRDDQLCAPEDLEFSRKNYLAGIGSGMDLQARFPVTSFSVIDSDIQPRAAAIAKLAEVDFLAGKGRPAELAQPVYLRESVAWKS